MRNKKITADVDGAAAAAALARAAPPEGPVFSGPHLRPWVLRTEQNGLGPPLDEHGNAAPRMSLHYMSASQQKFLPYDIDQPPAPGELVRTMTDQGVEVPYIVRRETGAADRGIYELAVLHDPTRPWSATDPQPGWNRKLYIYTYGGWNQYWSQSVLLGEPLVRPGVPPAPTMTVLIDMALSRGFMVARTTFTQSMTNSDPVRGAELLVMLKAHIAANYGPIRYTLASGASGGSIMQQMITNQYPGILQGIIPMSSLHATFYLPSVLIDSRLLERYFTVTSPRLWRSEADRLAVDGHRSEETRHMFNTVFAGQAAGSMDPTVGTGLPDELAYHPERNPGGVRGTLQDYLVNYLGRRPESVWTAPERAAGFGFADLCWDNTGVQYGLGALLDGKISAEQFVDRNERIGGVDLDSNFIAERTQAHPGAVANLHRGGFLNDFANMAGVAILDVRNPEEEDPVRTHTQFHTWVTRAGLVAAHGRADNQVAWIVPGFLTFTTPPQAAFLAMDRWLAAVEADDGDRPLAEKIVAHRPADLVDGLHDPDGNLIGDLAECHRRYPCYGDARTVAACGDLRSMRVAKPQLKSLNPADYRGIVFTESQWQRLMKTFPRGVADWSAPGIGETPTVPWLNYADGPGGQPLSWNPTRRTPSSAPRAPERQRRPMTFTHDSRGVELDGFKPCRPTQIPIEHAYDGAYFQAICLSLGQPANCTDGKSDARKPPVTDDC